MLGLFVGGGLKGGGGKCKMKAKMCLEMLAHASGCLKIINSEKYMSRLKTCIYHLLVEVSSKMSDK